jgi:hypothetical protein
MARNTPSRPEPSGLPAASQYLKGITRADQSTIGGQAGGVYSRDSGGDRVDPRRIPATLDSVGASSSTSPLGQPTAGRR